MWEFDMNAGFLLKALLLSSLVVCIAPPTQASNLFCAPFLHGKVAQPALDTMLDAARLGHLYRIDAKTSEVDFCVDSRIKRVRGRFRDVEGGIAMKPRAERHGQALLAIDTDSVSTSNPLIENIIKSETFIDVAHYPEILFVSTGFEWLAETTGVLKGDLTLRGITRPVTFNVEISDLDGNRVGNSDTLLISIVTTIRRADFGMKKMAGMVSETVQLCMRVLAKKSGHTCLQCHDK